jgi:hypothetical protein
MAPQEQLEWEERNAPRAGIAAIGAGVCILLSLFYPVLAGTTSSSARTYDRLITVHDRPTDVIVPSVLLVLAFPLGAYALVYMYRAAKARRPETLRITYVLAIAGPLAVAIASAMRGIAIIDIASKAADSGIPNAISDPTGGAGGLAGIWDAGEKRAADLTTDSTLYVATEIIAFVGRLAYGFALVLVGLNAMRAGLLSRFIGILGIIAGVVAVLLRGAGPIEAFWFIAVGLLILDRWPSGRGPAWETGEATPWPTAIERQRQVLAERGELPEGDAEAEDAYEEEDDEGVDSSEPTPKAHPVSRKRKKKKRR